MSKLGNHLKPLAVLFGVMIPVVTFSWWEFAQAENIRDNGEIINAVQITQQKVVDWMDQDIQRKRSIVAQQHLLRYLCESGKLSGDDCKGVQVPPDSTEQPE